MSGMREVHLPAELCQAAETRFGQQFGSLDQFLVFVLEEMIGEHAFSLSRSEEQMIDQRLKDLGYA